MAYQLPPDQLKNLKLFIEFCKQDPNVLHHHDLVFFKKYIESLGGVIPPQTSKSESKAQSTKTENKDEPEVKEPEEPEPEVESEESEVELDYEGCIEPDNDPPQTMGYTKEKVTEEDMNKSDEKKRAAIELYNEQKYEEAINAYTEAILLNPTSALLYAKRGQCYLQLKKPNACIRDCTRALEINPDNAAAYKFRGRAHRLIGNFVKGAEDLRNACMIDYDEQADKWLAEVTPNAKKLEEHRRKYERKRLEKEVKETRERIRKMKEEQQKRAAEMKDMRQDSDDEGIDGGQPPAGGMGDFLNILKDPELMSAFQDPEVAAAFQDMLRNPANFMQSVKNNPKISAVFNKLSSKIGGKVPGGFPGFPGGFPFNPEDPNKKPPPSSDIDLD